MASQFGNGLRDGNGVYDEDKGHYVDLNES